MADMDLPEDVLQNIEFAAIQVYRAHPELTDYEVDKAYEALERRYKAEERGRRLPTIRLDGLSKEVHDVVETMCEWRLGRPPEGSELPPIDEPLTPDLLVQCLKYLRKSVSLWTEEGGRQGYLQYIDNFLV